MKKSIRIALLASGVVLSAACAELQIYRDMNLETRTGIPFYISKPYLLVVRNGAKDTPLSASVIYLPDLSNTLYARIVPGMGSSKTNLAFTNSVLASVGQESDAQVDELLTSVGGLATSFATAGLTRQQTRDLREEAADAATIAQAADLLVAVASGAREQARLAGVANVLTEPERTTLEAIARAIDGSVRTLRDPTQAQAQLAVTIANLTNAAKNWDDGVRAASAATAGDELTIRRQLATLRGHLGDAIRLLKGPEGREGGPVYELYEIDNRDRTRPTVLRRVTTE